MFRNQYIAYRDKAALGLFRDAIPISYKKELESAETLDEALMRMAYHVSHSSIHVRQILAKLDAEEKSTNLKMDGALFTRQIIWLSQILEIEPDYYMKMAD